MTSVPSTPPDSNTAPCDRCSPRGATRPAGERKAIRPAAPRIDRTGAARLGASVGAMAAALKRGDVPAMAAADAGFHDLVVELAANPVLIGMVGPMRDMMVESQRLPMVRLDRLGETLAERRAIAARLAAGDADGAARAMQAHIRATGPLQLQWQAMRAHRNQRRCARSAILHSRRQKGPVRVDSGPAAFGRGSERADVGHRSTSSSFDVGLLWPTSSLWMYPKRTIVELSDFAWHVSRRYRKSSSMDSKARYHNEIHRVQHGRGLSARCHSPCSGSR
ncbi:MAG: FCD domain-containing protein [Janthinobacterium lividum]